jgi:hypothetical protein
VPAGTPDTSPVHEHRFLCSSFAAIALRRLLIESGELLFQKRRGHQVVESGLIHEQHRVIEINRRKLLARSNGEDG